MRGNDRAQHLGLQADRQRETQLRGNSDLERLSSSCLLRHRSGYSLEFKSLFYHKQVGQIWELNTYFSCMTLIFLIHEIRPEVT